MTIKEQLDSKKAALAEFKDAVSENDADAMEQAKAIIAEIAELEEKLEKAAEADAILAAIENPIENQEKSMDQQIKSLGDLAVKAFAGIDTSEKFDVTSETEFKGTPAGMGTVEIRDYDKHGYQVMPESGIRNLFGTETISGNALTFFTETDKDGSIATVAEFGQKPQIDFTITPHTVNLKKVAGYIVESDEIIEDAPWLASAINNRLVHKLRLAVENQLLAGNGTGSNITGLANTSGIGSVTYATTLTPDAILEAILKVKNDSGFDADAIVLNAADLLALMQMKDQNDQYLFSGPAYMAYGNGNAAVKATLWGVPCYVSAAITAGNPIVGAFKVGASVVTKGGIKVGSTNSNADDFTNNRVTVRAEERMTLAVYHPAAFVKISKASS